MTGDARPTAPGRAAFALFRPLTLRWGDNDAYGHVNNVVYYALFDTLVNAWLAERGLLDIARGPVICLVVESGCRYFAPLAFPEPVEGALRVARLGRSSVTWDIGIFARGAPQAAAAGRFVHVLVDRGTRRPVAFPDDWHTALSALG